MSPRYVYRALREDEQNVHTSGIWAKVPYAGYDPVYHIRNGSRQATDWISTTEDLAVAAAYAATHNRETFQIAKIRLSRIPNNRRFSWERAAGRDRRIKLAKSTREVLIRDRIPPSAIERVLTLS